MAGRKGPYCDYYNDNSVSVLYTHGPGIDQPVAMNINGSTYFYIPDIQGSIRAIVDMDGNLMASYVYDVWGTLVSYNGTLAQKNDYLYTGREYDWETGIYYYRYRYYNPEIGRFMQSSWELNEEMNMYVYVNNDPVKGTDPTGHPYRPPILFDHGTGGFIGPGSGPAGPGGGTYGGRYNDMPSACEICKQIIYMYCAGQVTAAGLLIGFRLSPAAVIVAFIYGMIMFKGGDWLCSHASQWECETWGFCTSSSTSSGSNMRYTSKIDIKSSNANSGMNLEVMKIKKSFNTLKEVLL